MSTPSFNPLEQWTLARALSGQPVPPNLPIRENVYKWAEYLEKTPAMARFAALERVIGSEAAWTITTIDLTLPMPTVTATKERNHVILADDLKRLKSPSYALDSYPIYEQSLNALVGPSGAGKSFVAVDVCGKLSAKGASVCYIAGEGLFGYSTRWETWKGHHGLKNAPKFRFWDTAVNFLDNAALSAFMEQLQAMKPDMLVVDTVARSMAGGDENSTRDMGLFIAVCDRIRDELKTGLLLIHHTGKNGTMRGSSALFAACDSVMTLNRVDNQITVYNTLDQGGKNKYSAEAFPILFNLIPKTVSTDGKVFESAVLVPSAHAIRSDSDKLTTNQRLVLEALDGHENGLNWAVLKDVTGIPESSFNRVVKQVISRKWVDEGDKRYTITAEGKDKLLST